MNNPYVAFIQDVLITLHANIRDLKERRNFADPEELTYIEAKLLAYNEILSILRSSADDTGIDRKEVGL
ncbi:MAG TPA: hypothetical protein VIM75_20095 [Ohtaekwangia sp.]|uniref:hypothetical protein n=1 Tax=Ohtaekwangia sp. TaxID=2066019 RepID=UPI002F9224FD